MCRSGGATKRSLLTSAPQLAPLLRPPPGAAPGRPVGLASVPLGERRAGSMVARGAGRWDGRGPLAFVLAAVRALLARWLEAELGQG